MKQCVISTKAARAIATLVLAGSALLPTACGDDESPGNPPGTGGAAPATGGVAPATGGAAPVTGGAGGGPTGGAGGTGGTATGGTSPDVPDASPDSSTDSGVAEDTLDKTGLYAPGGGEVLASGVRAYDVRFQLWSDGATKRRFLYLPPGTKIDTTNMDLWAFPVGTKVWKEFTRDGVRVETRLLEKVSAAPDAENKGWKRVAYAWNAAQTKAVAVPDGALAALGTEHDIPGAGDCDNCHQWGKDYLIGVSAIQLAHSGTGVTLKSLMDDGLLTTPPASSNLPLPGNAGAQAALGVIHANCGLCHQPGSFAYTERAIGMDLRLTVGTLATVQGTPIYQTTVNVDTSKSFEGATKRIVPGDAAHSALHQRMSTRDDLMKMPPVATKIVDENGAKAVRDWIASLSQ
jgi:hypothetical protein